MSCIVYLAAAPHSCVIFWGNPSAAVGNSARSGDWLFPAGEISWFHLPWRRSVISGYGASAAGSMPAPDVVFDRLASASRSAACSFGLTPCSASKGFHRPRFPSRGDTGADLMRIPASTIPRTIPCACASSATGDNRGAAWAS